MLAHDGMGSSFTGNPASDHRLGHSEFQGKLELTEIQLLHGVFDDVLKILFHDTSLSNGLGVVKLYSEFLEYG